MVGRCGRIESRISWVLANSLWILNRDWVIAMRRSIGLAELLWAMHAFTNPSQIFTRELGEGETCP